MSAPRTFRSAFVLGAVALAVASLSARVFAADDTMSKTGTKYKAGRDMQEVLTTLGAMNGKPIQTLEPAEARKQPTPTDAVVAVLKKRGKDTSPAALVPAVTSKDTEIPGPAGQLPVRVYTPDGAGPFPVIVYYHGGGWVIANKDVYDGGARGIAKQANAVVISVDYRLAPEAKFPAQHEDALATYKWAAQNAAASTATPSALHLPARARAAT